MTYTTMAERRVYTPITMKGYLQPNRPGGKRNYKIEVLRAVKRLRPDEIECCSLQFDEDSEY